MAEKTEKETGKVIQYPSALDATQDNDATAFVQGQEQTEEQPLNAADDALSAAAMLAEERNAQQMQEAAAPDVIGEEEIQKAMDILNKYKAGKTNLDNRIVENQQWWKMRHWGYFKTESGEGDAERIKPASAWLHSCIDNKVADYMDNYPEPNILPQEPNDQETAEILSAIVPVILEANNFETIYNDNVHAKVENGTGLYSVIWNQSKLNGLGDIDIVQCDMLRLFWEPGVKDIQKSPHFFNVDLVSNDDLEAQYPQLKDKLGGNASIQNARYIFDDQVDTSDKTEVVDWYYKVNVHGRNLVHYVKFCNNTVLYATENDPERADKGLYDDGKYPFVFDPLFSVEGSPAGYGYVDLCKEPQQYIDKLSQAMLENAVWSATPRWLIRDDGEIDEKDVADASKHFIKVGVNVGSDSIMPVAVNGIDGNAFNMLTQKIDEMKETSGNRDVSSGGTASGVTAASAISAMQEAGSKTSRWQIKGSYRAYKEIILMVIERIRQFYDLPRTFRITGKDGSIAFVEFTNQDMQQQEAGEDFSTGEERYRLPIYDVNVAASKSSPYSKLAQNEMAIQMYQLGVFNPQNTDQALALLDTMDINHKESIVQRVQQNGTMYDSIQQLTQALTVSNEIIAQLTGQDLMNGQMPPAGQMSGSAVTNTRGVDTQQHSADSLGDAEKYDGNSLATQARKRTAESTSPV